MSVGPEFTHCLLSQEPDSKTDEIQSVPKKCQPLPGRIESLEETLGLSIKVNTARFY